MKRSFELIDLKELDDKRSSSKRDQTKEKSRETTNKTMEISPGHMEKMSEEYESRMKKKKNAESCDSEMDTDLKKNQNLSHDFATELQNESIESEIYQKLSPLTTDSKGETGHARVYINDPEYSQSSSGDSINQSENATEGTNVEESAENLNEKVMQDTPIEKIYYPALQGSRSVNEFLKLNRIEEGTFGVVFRARNSITGETVALKRLKMENEFQGFPITSLREINTLLRCHHENVVRVKEVVVGNNMDDIYIVMEYIEHDLKSLMETMTHPFLLGEVKTLMIQLLRGVHHLHDNWILHRDLKSSNLLLSHNGILKIGDFGLAREFGSPLKPYTPIVVTLWYRAPELLLETKMYSTAIDLWSCGCIMAELITKKPLFNGKNEIQQINKIFQELGTPNDKIWPGPPAFSELPVCKKVTFTVFPYNKLRKRFGTTITEAGYQLLNRFLTYDPERRISAEEALKHEFFKESPLPVPPSLFPTWPAKSEIYHHGSTHGLKSKTLPDGTKPAEDKIRRNLTSSAADPSFFPVPTGGGFNLRF